MTRPDPERMRRILGLGLDQRDGHVRITRGDGFDLYLGSEASHEEMQQLCLKIQRRLDEEGRKLTDLTRDEFRALLERIE